MPLLSAPPRWHLDRHTPPPPSATPSCHAGPTPSTVLKEIIASSRSGPTAVSGGACAARREQQPPSSWFFSRTSGIPLRPACRALQWAAVSSQLRTRCAGTPSGYDTKPGNKYCYTGVCNAGTKICDPVPLSGPCTSADQCASGSSCVSGTCQVRFAVQPGAGLTQLSWGSKALCHAHGSLADPPTASGFIAVSALLLCSPSCATSRELAVSSCSYSRPAVGRPPAKTA